MNNFAQRLREARERTGLTQKQFSERAQLSVSALASYEQGHHIPPLNIAVDIARAADVSLDWLSGIVTDDEILRSLITAGHAPEIKAFRSAYTLSLEAIKNIMKEGK